MIEPAAYFEPKYRFVAPTANTLDFNIMPSLNFLPTSESRPPRLYQKVSAKHGGGRAGDTSIAEHAGGSHIHAVTYSAAYC